MLNPEKRTSWERLWVAARRVVDGRERPPMRENAWNADFSES